MAETKKKSTSKKTDSKSVKKPTVSKAKKTVEHKKKSSKTTKKVSNKKETSKKVEHKEPLISEEIPNEINNDSNKIIIGLTILVLFLLVGIVYLLMNNSNQNIPTVNSNSNVDNNLVNSSTQNMSSDRVVLTVIEDPNCKTCKVDAFTSKIKDNLIKNLDIKKVSIESKEGKDILKSLNLNQVPAYIFSENINKRPDWTSQLAPAFITVQLNGKNSYLLNPQYVPEKVMINEPKILDGAVVYGNKSAKVTIYEFSDYECPFCGIAEGNKDLVAQFSARQPGYVPPMPQVYKNYIDTGKVKLVFYNMPLTQLHPKVRPNHLAALCANEQGKWREFHDKLFSDRSDWVGSSDYIAKMKDYAKDLGLNMDQFNKCLDSKKYSSQIDAEIAYGQSLGVSGTPAFFIGKQFISGAQDYSTFKNLIDSQLNASS